MKLEHGSVNVKFETSHTIDPEHDSARNQVINMQKYSKSKTDFIIFILYLLYV